MPELPDLEVMCEILTARTLDRMVHAARVHRPGILKTSTPSLEALAGRSIERVSRRGKHLILTLGKELHVVLHLMVAGRLVLCKGGTKVTKATGFTISFVDGEDLRLVENGSVKRAQVHIVRDPADVEWIRTGGVEPLSGAFSVEYLKDRFSGVRRTLRKALTDQTWMVGIGAAYADEILYAARLSPVRYVSTLDDEEMGRLHSSVRAVLRTGIEAVRARADGKLVTEQAREQMKVYHRTGEPCARCGDKIAEIRYAEKRIYYCPTCQSDGQEIADRRAWLRR